jgi:Na+(H+)/acetate symporter ActP
VCSGEIRGAVLQLTFVDWLIMLLYFVFVLGIGFALKRYMKTSKDFFQAGRALPAWICGLAFISANLGAQEVIWRQRTSTASARSLPWFSSASS